MHRTNRSIFSAWTAAIEAQSALWTTLSIRLPLLATGTMTPEEQIRMVAEKFEAWTESAGETFSSVGRMMLNPTAAMRSPAALLGAMMSIASAAAKPYQKRLTANARRLRDRKG